MSRWSWWSFSVFLPLLSSPGAWTGLNGRAGFFRPCFQYWRPQAYCIHGATGCNRRSASMSRGTGKTGAGQPRGFTLLEVLVALSVMVFALSALWKILGQSTAVVDALPDRVLAMWCAHNHVVLRLASLQWREPQVYKGSEDMVLGGGNRNNECAAAETHNRESRHLTRSPDAGNA